MADNEDNINSGEEDVDAQPSMKQNPTTERLKKKLKAKANMNTTTKPEKKQGLNYTAITMMVLMLAPALFALVTNVYDYYHPEAAMERRIRSRLVKCYTAASPDKLATIDDTLKKYKGKEHILFSKLKAKYEKYDECS